MHSRVISAGSLLATALVLGVVASAHANGPTSPPSSDGRPQTTRFEIRVDHEGYHPEEIRVRPNQRVTLVFTRTESQGCGQVLKIPSRNIRRDLPVNQPVKIELDSGPNGTLRFTCGMDMLQGRIVVQ